MQGGEEKPDKKRSIDIDLSQEEKRDDSKRMKDVAGNSMRSNKVAAEDGIQTVVRDHFNARPRHDRESRVKSDIIHLRSFNNWVKSILIQEFVRDDDSVLDLACGKGGDLWKWQKRNIYRLVGIDIAEKSIEEAKSRYDSMGKAAKRFKAEFMVGNAFSSSVVDSLVGETEVFDIISCQFAFHYAFESKESARDAVRLISKHLLPGGRFFCTIPNSVRLLELLNESKGLEFGNSLYNVKFDSKDIKPFGTRYTFYLKDAIDSCPEYLINISELEELFTAEGLELVFNEAFPVMFYEFREKSQYKFLMEKMRVLNEDNTIDPEEWDAISLYSSLCFRKRMK